MRPDADVDLLEDFRQDTVMGDFLDLQQSPIGLESNGPQSGQVVQSLAGIEIVRVIDGGLSSQGTAFLVVLLDASSRHPHVAKRSPLE